MLNRICLAAGLLALAFETSAGVVPKPIAPQLPIEVVQAQQEVAIDVPTTASAVGGGFGLIGAIIGSAVQNAQAKGAEERVTGVRDALIGYDFNANLERALRAKLASGDISPDPQFNILTPAAVAERIEKRAAQPTQALVLGPRYAFDYEMTTLTVKVVATLENRERKSNGKYKYRTQFKHTYAFSFPIAQPNQTSAPWTALGREGLVALLDQGIAQVSDMIAYDFTDQGRSEWDRDNRKQFVRIKGRGFPGMSIREEADFVWARVGKFDGQVVQGWQPLDGPIQVAKVATPEAAPVIAPATASTSAPIAAEPAAATPVAAAPVVAEPATPVAPVEAPLEAPAAAAGGSQ